MPKKVLRRLLAPLSFNRRNSRARGMLFYRLLQQAVATDPHPLSELYSSR